MFPFTRTGVQAMDRRSFLKRSASAALFSSTVSAISYPFLEARWCHVVRCTITLANLPQAFRGTKIALLGDIHHGPFVPEAYVHHVVAMTNALKPDIIALVGDYVHRHSKYIKPAMGALGQLTAALGRYAVRGNHDNCAFQHLSEAALADAGLCDLNNKGIWLERNGARLRICGVGDLWTDHQNLAAALADADESDAVLLLSHNPDYVEVIRDSRVGLVLSGHTHGGQVFIPGYGAPIVPSRYGQKYLYGLVQGPFCRVFVTCGVGTITPPVRFLCRPEVVLVTLV
jgi:predicted MPP superfamily phosphohydrolase